MDHDEADAAVREAYGELGLDCGIDAFETAFFISDHLLHAGFVAKRPAFQIGKFVSDTAMSWYGFLHGLIVPNPQSMMMTRESRALSSELKDRIIEHMDLLARHYRSAQHALETNRTDELAAAIGSIVALRFSTLADLFDDVHRELDAAWAEPEADDLDQRTYG